MVLPVILGKDVYATGGSRLLISFDEQLYLGFTPTGKDPDRNFIARVTPVQNKKPVPFTCTLEDDLIVLRTGSGYLKFGLTKDDTVIAEGENISLVVSNGKAMNMFMGGGNVVKDGRGGVLFAIAGIKFRFLEREAVFETDSRWNFDYLCDPDPRLYIDPSENGRISFAVFAAEYEMNPVDDGKTVIKAAEELKNDFNDYSGCLIADADDPVIARAAWTLWNALQPQRTLYDCDITTNTVLIHGRNSSGSIYTNDSVLYSLVLKDPADAAAMLVDPLQYQSETGMVPAEISNCKVSYYCELPLFGVALTARADIMEKITKEQYCKLKKALLWWKENRFCNIRKLFYYRHNMEAGEGRCRPMAHLLPTIAPELNVFLYYWITAMEKLAEKFDTVYVSQWRMLAADILNGISQYLTQDGHYKAIDVTDKTVDTNYPGNTMPSLLDAVMTKCAINAEQYECEVLALCKDRETAVTCAEKVRNEAENGNINTVRDAIAVILAQRILSGGVTNVVSK